MKLGMTEVLNTMFHRLLARAILTEWRSFVLVGVLSLTAVFLPLYVLPVGVLLVLLDVVVLTYTRVRERVLVADRRLPFQDRPRLAERALWHE